VTTGPLGRGSSRSPSNVEVLRPQGCAENTEPSCTKAGRLDDRCIQLPPIPVHDDRADERPAARVALTASHESKRCRTAQPCASGSGWRRRPAKGGRCRWMGSQTVTCPAKANAQKRFRLGIGCGARRRWRKHRFTPDSPGAHQRSSVSTEGRPAARCG